MFAVESADELLRVQHFKALDGLDVAGGYFAFLVHDKREFLRLVVLPVHFKFHLLEVKDDIGHVLDHARKRGELVLRACDFRRGDSCSFRWGRDKTPRGLPTIVTITRLHGLTVTFG